MSFRKASIFLLVSTILTIAMALYVSIVLYLDERVAFLNSYDLMIGMAIEIMMGVLTLLISLNGIRNKTPLLRPGLSIFLLAATVVDLLWFVYTNHVELLSFQYYWSIFWQYLTLFAHLGMVLFAYFLYTHPVRLKSVSWALIITSLIVLFKNCFVYLPGVADMILDMNLTFWVIMPFVLLISQSIALMLYAFSIEQFDEVTEDFSSGFISRNDSLLDDGLNREVKRRPAGAIRSMRNWTMQVFFSSIPVVGLFFLSYWTRFSRSAEVRSWAMAQLLLSGGWVLLMVYVQFQGADSFKMVFGITCIIIMLFAARLVTSIVKKQQEEPEGESASVSDWLFGRLLISSFPVIGWIYLALWLKDNEDPNRRNWAGAQLIVVGLTTLMALNFWC